MEGPYNWDFGSVFVNWQLLAIGLVNTIQLAVFCLLFGLFFGFFVGIARYSRRRLFNWPATAFVEVFRNTPALVQIMCFFSPCRFCCHLTSMLSPPPFSVWL
jgi:polar amino acid transport system permease protein